MKGYRLARSVLFKLDAERSHELTIALLSRHPMLAGFTAGRLVQDPVRLMGLEFRNRVGLAAGLDKNGEAIEAFDRMGFGFIEIGTVTPRPQPGNPRPRLFRLPQAGALINRFGFNNHGVDALVKRAVCARRHAVLGINIGKNADTPIENAVDDYLIGLQKVYPVADYVTINISSPNTKGLRDLQQSALFDQLLDRIAEARTQLSQRHAKRRPLLIKIAPDVDNEQLQAIAESVRTYRIDGLIATNTTITRTGVKGLLHAQETGGLSGAPLRARANEVTEQLRAKLGPDYPLIGAGGIMSAADAVARYEAGADLVQLYTGLIYRGPELVTDCARALQAMKRRPGHAV